MKDYATKDRKQWLRAYRINEDLEQAVALTGAIALLLILLHL